MEGWGEGGGRKRVEWLHDNYWEEWKSKRRGRWAAAVPPAPPPEHGLLDMSEAAVCARRLSKGAEMKAKEKQR